jgi:hypothetical protein
MKLGFSLRRPSGNANAAGAAGNSTSAGTGAATTSTTMNPAASSTNSHGHHGSHRHGSTPGSGTKSAPSTAGHNPMSSMTTLAAASSSSSSSRDISHPLKMGGSSDSQTSHSGSQGGSHTSVKTVGSSDEITFKLGDVVSVTGTKKVGVVKYSGEVHFSDGIWIGIELPDPTGKNDGSVQGVKYFNCKPKHGLFVRPNICSHSRAKPSNTTAAARTGMSQSVRNLANNILNVRKSFSGKMNSNNLPGSAEDKSMEGANIVLTQNPPPASAHAQPAITSSHSSTHSANASAPTKSASGDDQSKVTGCKAPFAQVTITPPRTIDTSPQADPNSARGRPDEGFDLYNTYADPSKDDAGRPSVPVFDNKYSRRDSMEREDYNLPLRTVMSARRSLQNDGLVKPRGFATPQQTPKNGGQVSFEQGLDQEKLDAVFSSRFKVKPASQHGLMDQQHQNQQQSQSHDEQEGQEPEGGSMDGIALGTFSPATPMSSNTENDILGLEAALGGQQNPLSNEYSRSTRSLGQAGSSKFYKQSDSMGGASFSQKAKRTELSANVINTIMASLLAEPAFIAQVSHRRIYLLGSLT